MTPDFTPVFQQYELLRADVDSIFSKMANSYPQCVTCHPGCSDCCHALFDLSLVEAIYINHAFAKKFDYGRERSIILERASSQDRQLTKLKRELFRAEKNGEPADKLIEMASTARMRCPLLDEQDRCLMYESRPLTCRLYGIPLAIDGKSRVCGFSNFDKGQSYPTVQLAKLHGRLDAMNAEIARISGTSLDLTDIYMPISMALLTNYDESWFGTKKDQEE